jgi:hypothetical protein
MIVDYAALKETTLRHDCGLYRVERGRRLREQNSHRWDQMKTVSAIGGETNVAGKMALRTGRNVLQFAT